MKSESPKASEVRSTKRSHGPIRAAKIGAYLLLIFAAALYYFWSPGGSYDEKAFKEIMNRYDRAAAERMPPAEVAQYVSQLSSYIDVISDDSTLKSELKVRYLNEIREKMYTFADILKDRAAADSARQQAQPPTAPQAGAENAESKPVN